MPRKQFNLAERAGELDVVFENPIVSPGTDGAPPRRLIPDADDTLTYVARRANTGQAEVIAEEIAKLGDAPARWEGPDAERAAAFWAEEHDEGTVVPTFQIRLNPEFVKHQNQIAVINLTRLLRDENGRPPSEELIRANFDLRLFQELQAELNPDPEDAAAEGNSSAATE